jgi:hypothetical protein
MDARLLEQPNALLFLVLKLEQVVSHTADSTKFPVLTAPWMPSSNANKSGYARATGEGLQNMLSAGTHRCDNASDRRSASWHDFIHSSRYIVSMCASWLASLLLLASWPSLRSHCYVFRMHIGKGNNEVCITELCTASAVIGVL